MTLTLPNGASFFFICLYLHIAKALYYGSYKSPRTLVWIIGVIIFILTIATAFMGNNSPKSKYIREINPPQWYINFVRNKIFDLVGQTYNLNNLNYDKYKIKNKHKINKWKIEKINIRNYSTKNKDITESSIIFKEIGIEPEIWWEDLNKGIIQEDIKNKLKNKSGIYIIINKISRNYYIGSGKINNLNLRFRNHLIQNNKKGSKVLKNALNKYGLNNFIYGILEFYPKPTNNDDNYIELLALETSYISLLVPQYNILTEASKFKRYKYNEYNLNNKLNLSKLSLTDERLNLLKDLRQKHKEYWDKEFYFNSKLIALNRPKNYLINEGRLNINKGSRKIIYIENIKNLFPDYTHKNNILCEFKSINQASHYLCCSTKTIQRCLKLGWIYIPDIFIPLLSNTHINKYNSLIEYINKNELYKYNYNNYLNKKFKIKSGLSNYNNFTKFYIKFNYARIVEN